MRDAGSTKHPALESPVSLTRVPVSDIGHDYGASAGLSALI